MRVFFVAVLALIFLASCTSKPELVFPDDFVPLQSELPSGLGLTRMNETFRAINYSENPGLILPEHYSQLYLHPDVEMIDCVMYVYLSPNGTFESGKELGYFVMAFKDEAALEAELDKVKDYVYFKDIRNFYIGRKGRFVIEYWSDESNDPRLRELFFGMQSRLGFVEVQPV
jgi:hypothetical protein